MKIYVASSWRCPTQQSVVERLRDEGHDVYDFRNPPGATGFGWHHAGLEDIHDPRKFLRCLETTRAIEGFAADMGALKACDACVLVMPCGRSAHLELGYAVGAGKCTVVLLDDPLTEPELMWMMADHIALTLDGVVVYLDLRALEDEG